MANRLIKTKAEATKLRLQGASYSQIKSQLGVSKSTLSGWLKKYPLPPERIRELRDFSEQRIENFRNTMRIKRETRQNLVYQKEKEYLLPLSKKELYLTGLFLYWGEGNKTTPYSTILSNSNPLMIKFFVYWLTNIFEVPTNKMRMKIHLYQDMDEQKEIKFWSNLTKISIKQFNKSYIKKTTLAGLTYKGFNHGTCNIMVHNRDIAEKVFLGIRAISDNINKLVG
ncbi:hypothetical protein A3A84_00510 [Candidatus Collierbacteria bacterium RIFCSPLOWO2_01_FULL_50_23]|uniref:Uncharacterized protein n=2 Tax=Candidatus Collieribacteriota TaxID=1752725 RepID=A0A1F5EW30_9BACT|nr:MAG: hypothetical protein A2703_00585 [Candidatus Collierbacteria bacterium RIFCSPHIGHO2_01_FULL_50_25]OGD71599.1 MAG: hypothetical protein A3D09_02830 [Candidatus Collierbacteria bacterium RIFCSPHIGHO2_02_FULL_49_10]OGD73881.1 MAG: hypothetical protein A3A84_00510 [Candidatus Collierbacteria bacterium RIFCSPLOWO2_01_FULL_50_23]